MGVRFHTPRAERAPVRTGASGHDQAGPGTAGAGSHRPHARGRSRTAQDSQQPFEAPPPDRSPPHHEGRALGALVKRPPQQQGGGCRPLAALARPLSTHQGGPTPGPRPPGRGRPNEAAPAHTTYTCRKHRCRLQLGTGADGQPLAAGAGRGGSGTRAPSFPSSCSTHRAPPRVADARPRPAGPSPDSEGGGAGRGRQRAALSSTPATCGKGGGGRPADSLTTGEGELCPLRAEKEGQRLGGPVPQGTLSDR